MDNLEDEYDWEGVAEDLAQNAKIWLNKKRIGDPKFQPNERLIRDYVAKGILAKLSTLLSLATSFSNQDTTLSMVSRAK